MYKKLLVLVSVAFLLVGCAATETMISKRKLDVQSKMSDTIFLNPVEDKQKTIYVQIKNTSDKPEFNITSWVKKSLQSRGYKVVTSPGKAHYLFQANILQVGKADITAASKAIAGGYGSSIQSVATGAVLGGVVSGGRSAGGIIAGGLVGGLVDTISNAAVKDVTYTVITDIQISERASEGLDVKQTDESEFRQGTGTTTKQSIASNSKWIRYQTRILSTANKVNLDFKDAIPLLEKGLVSSVAGIF